MWRCPPTCMSACIRTILPSRACRSPPARPSRASAGPISCWSICARTANAPSTACCRARCTRPIPAIGDSLQPGGMLREVAAATGRRVVFFCAFGERSAMAVTAAEEAGPCQHRPYRRRHRRLEEGRRAGGDGVRALAVVAAKSRPSPVRQSTDMRTQRPSSTRARCDRSQGRRSLMLPRHPLQLRRQHIQRVRQHHAAAFGQPLRDARCAFAADRSAPAPDAAETRGRHPRRGRRPPRPAGNPASAARSPPARRSRRQRQPRSPAAIEQPGLGQQRADKAVAARHPAAARQRQHAIMRCSVDGLARAGDRCIEPGDLQQRRDRDGRRSRPSRGSGPSPRRACAAPRDSARCSAVRLQQLPRRALVEQAGDHDVGLRAPARPRRRRTGSESGRASSAAKDCQASREKRLRPRICSGSASDSSNWSVQTFIDTMRGRPAAHGALSNSASAAAANRQPPAHQISAQGTITASRWYSAR